MYPPLLGVLPERKIPFEQNGRSRLIYEELAWLISQGDSTIYCLSVRSDKEIWKSEPTNRCDGRPALAGGRIAYGNCDGIVYVHDAETGKPLGTIQTSDGDDPMAGSMVVLQSGLMFTGTYKGNFLMLDPKELACLDTVKIADTEAFATPAAIGDTTIAMGTPDGRITLWETKNRKFESIGEIQVGKDGIDEMVFFEGKFWVLAGRALCKVDLESKQVKTFNIGDNMSCLTVNPTNGTLGLLADGDVVCIDVKGNGD
jgi:outer membrane protein assembly factor BamB